MNIHLHIFEKAIRILPVRDFTFISTYRPLPSLPSVPPIIFLTVTVTPAAWFEFYRSVFTFIEKIESTNISIIIAHIYNFIQLSFIL